MSGSRQLRSAEAATLEAAKPERQPSRDSRAELAGRRRDGAAGAGGGAAAFPDRTLPVAAASGRSRRCSEEITPAAPDEVLDGRQVDAKLHSSRRAGSTRSLLLTEFVSIRVGRAAGAAFRSAGDIARTARSAADAGRGAAARATCISPPTTCAGHGLGSTAPDVLPRIAIDADDRARAATTCCATQVSTGAPLVGFAPGAAYGHAKRWPPDRVSPRWSRAWCASAAPTCVLVGAAGDREAGREIESSLPPGARGRQPDRPHRSAAAAGVLARCRAFVSNDSGAMHLAAAVGVPGDGDLRADRRTGDRAARRSRRALASGVLPPLHAARVPDRSPVHEAASLSTRVRRRSRAGSTRAARRDRAWRVRPAVFLDRDGTLLEEAGYLDRLERLVVLSLQRRRRAPAEPRRLRRRRRHQPVRHRARHVSKSRSSPQAHALIDRTPGSRRRRIDALLLLPASPRRRWSSSIAATATAASRGPACCGRRRATSISTSALVRRRRSVERSSRRAWPSARAAMLVRTGYGRVERGAPTAARRRPAAIVDNLIAAVALDPASVVMARPRCASIGATALLALDRRLRRHPRRRLRRPDRRRVHLRRDRARVARGAGADPQLRLDRDRAGRRRQRREQRRRARRHPVAIGVAGATSRRAGCSSDARPRRRPQRRRAARLPHADEDAHPRRRHSLGQAAGRAHRSRGRAGRAGRRSRRRSRRAAVSARSRAATRCWSRTTAPGWSRRRSSRGASATLPRRRAAGSRRC